MQMETKIKTRQQEILERAAELPDWQSLSIMDIVEIILPGCPGPRTAKTYARELAWELFCQDLLERIGQRERYRLTPQGRQAARLIKQ
jgi:hypothetical protein